LTTDFLNALAFGATPPVKLDFLLTLFFSSSSESPALSKNDLLCELILLASLYLNTLEEKKSEFMLILVDTTGVSGNMNPALPAAPAFIPGAWLSVTYTGFLGGYIIAIFYFYLSKIPYISLILPDSFLFSSL
jgi:hypothetical protein